MVDCEKQALKHGEAAETRAQTDGHECAIWRYAGTAMAVIHPAEGERGHHSAMAQDRVGIAGVISIGDGHIVAAIPYIIRAGD